MNTKLKYFDKFQKLTLILIMQLGMFIISDNFQMLNGFRKYVHFLYFSLFICSGFFFAHIGWLLCRKHPEVIAKGKGLDISDLEACPILSFQRK